MKNYRLLKMRKRRINESIKGAEIFSNKGILLFLEGMISEINAELNYQKPWRTKK